VVVEFVVVEVVTLTTALVDVDATVAAGTTIVAALPIGLWSPAMATPAMALIAAIAM
jgi:hypothetical protein